MAAERREAVYRRRVDAFVEYDEHDFFQRYRITKQIARLICERYTAAGYGRKDGRGHAIADELMVCLCCAVLWLLKRKQMRIKNSGTRKKTLPMFPRRALFLCSDVCTQKYYFCDFSVWDLPMICMFTFLLTVFLWKV